MEIKNIFFKKKTYKPQITIEKLNHIFEYRELSGTTGWGGDSVIRQGIEVVGISVKDGGYYKEYKNLPAADVPKHIVFFKNPIFAYVTFVDSKIHYYYTQEGLSIRICPITTDKTQIKAIDGFFEYYYNSIGLPESLEKLKKKVNNKLKVTRKNKIKFLETYLSSDDKSFFEDNFKDIYDIVMWIDCKEYDEDIIKYCIEIMKTKELSVEVDENIEEERGIDIFITYKGIITKVDYEPEYTDRDRTIKTLNKAISEDYEIRLCSESFGGDTLCFIPLTNEQWLKLERNYPNELNEKFQKIENNSIFFGR